MTSNGPRRHRNAGERARAKSARSILAIVPLIVLTACMGPTATTPDSTVAPRGFNYFLSKDIVVVSGEVTLRKSVSIGKDLKLKTEHFAFRSTAGTAAVETVIDRDQNHLLDLSHSVFTNSDLTVTATAGGILSAVNANSQGRAGEVIKNIASFASTILPVLGILSADQGVVNEVFKIDDLKNAPNSAALKVKFKDLDTATQLYIRDSRRGRLLWLEIDKAERRLGTFKEERHQLLRSSATASKDEISLANARISSIKFAIELLKDELQKNRTAFAAGLGAFKSAKKLGNTDKTVPFNERFELTELPPPSLVKPGMEEDKVTEALLGGAKKYPRAGALWKSSRVVVTATPFAPAPPPVGAPPGDKDDLKIKYRRSVPIVLATYKLGKVAVEDQQTEQDLAVLVAKSAQSLMHPSSPVIEVAFNKSAFAERKLALTMNEKGELTILKRESTSAAEALTGSLSTAASGALATLQTSLTAVQKIAQTRRDIKLDVIKGDIARLEQEKKVVDSQVALQGASASAQLMQQKAQLDAQLATRQAEFNLTNAESSQQLKLLQNELGLLEAQLAVDDKNANLQLLLGQKILQTELANLNSQLALDKAKAAAGGATALQELTNQVSLLQQQLQLLKVQQEIKALQEAE